MRRREFSGKVALGSEFEVAKDFVREGKKTTRPARAREKRKNTCC
jgi:hypothetical protein